MQIFKNNDAQTFYHNNRKYVKNFIVMKIGDTHIAVYNAYDSKLQLMEATHYSNIKVDEVTFASQQALMEILAPMIFNKISTDETLQNNVATYHTFGILEGTGDITTANVADWLNAQTYSVNIGVTATPVIFEFLRTSFGNTKKYLFLFTGGKGTWGAARGLNPNPVFAGYFKLLSIQGLTSGDVEDDPNSNINYLGEIPNRDFKTVANQTEWNFTDPDKNYYFTFQTDGVLYFALFVGINDVYGGGDMDSNDFTDGDFVITTNNQTQPVVLPMWGSIEGNLASQTDLVMALDSKLNIPFGTSQEYIAGDGSLQPFPEREYPTLQSVLEAGNDSNGAIVLKSDSNRMIYEDSRITKFNVGNNLGMRINFPTPIENVTYSLPVKRNDETFAMISDVNAAVISGGTNFVPYTGATKNIVLGDNKILGRNIQEGKSFELGNDQDRETGYISFGQYAGSNRGTYYNSSFDFLFNGSRSSIYTTGIGMQFSSDNGTFDYAENYSSRFTNRSMVDKEYVDAKVATGATQDLQSILDHGSAAIINKDLNIKALSVAIGNGSQATGYSSTAIGYNNKAINSQSFAFGQYGSIASGNNSLAGGYFAKSIGENSFSFGYYTESKGSNSFAIGNQAYANGNNSLALGFSTTANGSDAISLGKYSTASGQSSVTLGAYSYANGVNSMVLGANSIANNRGEVVVGEVAALVNGTTPTSDIISASGDTRFRVGIGNTETFVRADGLRVYNSGLVTAPSATISGITAGTGRTLVTKEWVLANTSTGSTVAAWGSITGSLSAQTDLKAALEAKAIDANVLHKTGDETKTGQLIVNDFRFRTDGTFDTQSGNGLKFGRTVYPELDGFYDLGSNNLKWNDVHLGGKVVFNTTDPTILNSPSFKIETIADYRNPTTSALLIGSDTPLSGQRIFFGEPDNKIYAINFSNVNSLESVPTFFTNGLAVGTTNLLASHGIGRINDNVVINAGSPIGGKFQVYTNGSYSSGQLAMEISESGDTSFYKKLNIGNPQRSIGGLNVRKSFEASTNDTIGLEFTLDTANGANNGFSTVGNNISVTGKYENAYQILGQQNQVIISENSSVAIITNMSLNGAAYDGSTVQTYIGLDIKPFGANGTVSLTNKYGLYIREDLTSANTYGLYVEGQNSNNFLAGTLNVAGSITSNDRFNLIGATQDFSIDTDTDSQNSSDTSLFITPNNGNPSRLIFGKNNSNFTELSINADISLPSYNNAIVMTSPNGSRWRVTINDDGEFIKTSI